MGNAGIEPPLPVAPFDLPYPFMCMNIYIYIYIYICVYVCIYVLLLVPADLGSASLGSMGGYEEKKEPCGTVCLKYLLFAFNFFFWVSLSSHFSFVDFVAVIVLPCLYTCHINSESPPSHKATLHSACRCSSSLIQRTQEMHSKPGFPAPKKEIERVQCGRCTQNHWFHPLGDGSGSEPSAGYLIPSANLLQSKMHNNNNNNI